MGPKEELLRLNNKNKDFSLISRDCIGGILYHQLGLRFLSPTINLFLTPLDFNYLCLNLKDYMESELIEYKDESIPYPLGIISPKNLKPIRIDFMHYDSFKEAKEKWDTRKSRINYNNLFVVSSFCYIGETKTYSPKIVEDCNKIPYKKVIFVDKAYGFDNEVILSKDERCEEYAWLLYQDDIDNPGLRTFNKFDFIEFLNK